MRKVVFSALLGLPALLQAVSIEGDVSVFFPLSSHLRNIYGKVWPNFGITVDHVQPFPEKVSSLSIFGQVNYLFSSGRSRGGHQSTDIQLVPLTLGLKWIEKVSDSVEVYLGAAPRYYFMHIKNHSSYVPRTDNDNGCGFYATTGSFFYPTEHFMIDLFFSYSWMKFSAPSSSSSPAYIGLDTNVSGFDLGAGFGWKF